MLTSSKNRPSTARKLLVSLVALGGLLFLPTLLPGAVGASYTSTTQAFAVDADAEVNSANPTANYGSLSKVHTDASPVVRSYLRFVVQGLSGTVQSARLRLYPTSSQTTGFDVHAVADNSWGERTITYANAPAFSPTAVTSSGPVTSGTWVSVDITSLISGNGTYGVALTTSNTTNLAIASKEYGSAFAPNLVIATTPGSTPPGDTSPPSAPTNLSASGATQASIGLSWGASSDDVGVAGYDVFANGSSLGTTVQTSYTFSGASCGTTYTLGVDAYDTAGNRSPQATITASTTTTCASPNPPPASPSFPIRAAFYYPWFPSAWNQQGYVCGQPPPAGFPATPTGCFTQYHPSLGFYGSFTASVIDSHIRSMQYAGLNAAISSWWGQGSHTDQAFPGLLHEADLLGTGFKWAIYYEPGSTAPVVAQIESDLTYLHSHYAADPAYLKIGGKFVVWVYNDAAEGCTAPSVWKQANDALGDPAYIGMKVFSGYNLCSAQPDAWHQYAPAQATESIAGQAFSISPGFYKANETSPRLTRDPSRWATNIDSMIASKAPWQLVTTFNEWGEGTSVESAGEWQSVSGQGTYLDILHAKLSGADASPPSAPTSLAISGATATSLSLAWAASTDNVGVAGYDVYVGAGKVGSTPATSYTAAGLACGTTYAVAIKAYDAAGNVSSAASISAATSACSPSPSGSDPLIAAAGDIACDPTNASFNGGAGTTNSCRERWTSNLLLGVNNLKAVLPLGDTQYECGDATAFSASYDPTWGRVKQITRWATGNHEYGTSCGRNDNGPAVQYFNPPNPKGWYSYDIGSWHLIALNSECSYGSGASAVGGCGAGSPQETWLKNDLAAHQNLCTLAYWHEPRFSSGQHGDAQQMATIWNDLVNAHVDIVLSGHNHDYERFEPLGATPQASGSPSYQGPSLDPNGIREFVVGTGGKNHYSFGSQPPLAGEVVRNSDTYGVLQLTLHPTGYDWQFVNDPGSGAFTDSGSGSCH